MEAVDIIDENNQFVRRASRQEANEKLLRTRAVRVFLIRAKKILVQKRISGNADQQHCWDIGLAEGLASGEDYIQAAIRGLMRDFGIIDVATINLKFLFKYEDEGIKRWYRVYSLDYDGTFALGKDVLEAKFVSPRILERMKGKFFPQAVKAYERWKRGED